LTNLIELKASKECGLEDEGITNLVNLKKLDVSDNYRITDINYMINLIESYACGNKCGLENKSIINLYYLKILDASDNHKITRILIK